LILINKVDSPAEEDRQGDFYRLGQEDLLVFSAEHKRNLEILEERLVEILPALPPSQEEEPQLRIALVGRINVGKSSIINLLSGEERLIVSEIPGTTRDSIDTIITRNKKDFCLVDTAGIRKLSRIRDNREKASIIKAKKDIRQADVICLVMDAKEFPTRQDTAIAHLALESGKPLLLALNKWDLIEKDERSADEYKDKVYHKLKFVSYAPLIFISALSGQRVIKILDAAEDIYARGSIKISTPRLNNFLVKIQKSSPPISQKGHKIKIKYMTQKATLPPTFVLFTHSRVSLAPAYEKYFAKLLREEFKIIGNPVRLFLRKN
jgi:GTP-binding protein